MIRYFYITQFAYDPSRTLITRVMGYITNGRHTFFFPDKGYSREEVIAMLKVGIVVFLYDGCYHRMYVKLVKTETGDFLRVDHHKHPSDYLGY